MNGEIYEYVNEDLVGDMIGRFKNGTAEWY